MKRNIFPLCLAATSFTLFAAGWAWRAPTDPNALREVFDRIVISAPAQVILAGGDRFLAANFESFRAVATTSDAPGAAESNILFGIRSRHAVSQLNPCHEDNYYQGNALLTWGGAVAEGNDLLRRAMDCRTWDELPPFFYGFNQYFFLQDVDGARRALETAAQRSTANAATFKRIAIMFAAGEYKDDGAARAYLERERAEASDPRLKQMLAQRIVRLDGLIELRKAQRTYESRFGKPLKDPASLISDGILEDYPTDPLGIGYEFADGHFRLKEVKIAGLERP